MNLNWNGHAAVGVLRYFIKAKRPFSDSGTAYRESATRPSGMRSKHHPTLNPKPYTNYRNASTGLKLADETCTLPELFEKGRAGEKTAPQTALRWVWAQDLGLSWGQLPKRALNVGTSCQALRFGSAKAQQHEMPARAVGT